MIKLAISGCCGKMGSRIAALARQDRDFNVAALIEITNHPQIGKEVDGVTISDKIDAVKNADALIEFTSPAGTIEHLDACVKFSKPMVIGATGLSEEEILKLKIAAKRIPIVFSPNMSVGVNCLFGLVKMAAKRLGLDYKVNIIESHHIHKKDAPSGTAKKLAQLVKEAGGKEAEGIKSIREGELIGDHRVIFESDVDRIELFHSAKTRDIFALGALRAARFVIGKKPKLYSMEDAL